MIHRELQRHHHLADDHLLDHDRRWTTVCFARFAGMLLEEADRLVLEASRHDDPAAGELATSLYAKVAQMRADGPGCTLDGLSCATCPLKHVSSPALGASASMPHREADRG